MNYEELYRVYKKLLMAYFELFRQLEAPHLDAFNRHLRERRAKGLDR